MTEFVSDGIQRCVYDQGSVHPSNIPLSLRKVVAYLTPHFIDKRLRRCSSRTHLVATAWGPMCEAHARFIGFQDCCATWEDCPGKPSTVLGALQKPLESERLTESQATIYEVGQVP